jgi:hypothetical protein
MNALHHSQIRLRSQGSNANTAKGVSEKMLPGLWVFRRNQSNRLGNEGHCGPQQDDVRASTSGALPNRIKRPTRNHIGFIRLKNFPEKKGKLSHGDITKL